MKMTRSTYFAACMSQSVAWLKACVAVPSPSMRPRHILLILLAIRKKGG